MDVALDANVILNDPRMKGNAFGGLLDYLKKTNSRLVLTRIVLDEVIARYPERLRSATHKATAAVGVLSNLASDPKISLPRVDINRETRKLKQKLLRPFPSRASSSCIVNNFTDVRIEEVAKRGIERIPPANGGGEELRDVIHWLMLLAYASGSGRELAFITADEHFRHENELHPQLQKDVQDKKVTVHFHTSLDGFIKAHAPAPHTLTEPDAFDLYGKTHVLDRFEIEARRFFPSRWPRASSINVVHRDVRLLRGALYDVGPHSQFGEMEFSGEIDIRVTTTKATSFVSSYTPVSSTLDQDLVDYQLLGSAKSVPIDARISYQTLEDIYALANYDHSSMLTPAGTIGPVTYDFNVPQYDRAKTPYLIPTSAPEDVSEFRVKGSIVISLRVVSGKVEKIDTERFELGAIEKSG